MSNWACVVAGAALLSGSTAGSSAGGMAPAPIKEAQVESRVPESVYAGELVRYPGPWAFQLGRSHIILVSDKELEALADPDKVLNLTLTFDKQEASLRQTCERAQAAGHRTLVLAFDHFFSQYRPGQAGPRRLMPDMDEYVAKIAAISKFAAKYGLGLELSLLTPLEIGGAYARQTGETGMWMHYRKGLRDPRSGAYSVQLLRQLRWTNNKGPFPIADAGVRVFAFREQRVGRTPYRFVDPKQIVEITETAKVQVMGRPGKDANSVQVRIYGTGRSDVGPLDRVMAIQQYRTPEMDYFSPKALPYLKQLVDKYADAGVRLNALYSDEMHIQQDWAYFDHHDHGELALRYVSPGLARKYAELYGAEYTDFAKYLVYFIHAQEDAAGDLSAKQDVMHVMGRSAEDIRRTALFRARYYRLLQDGVVDLFVSAKRHAEKRMGQRLESRAHATWAESPTIDYWRTGQDNQFSHAYEYTSNFVWSNTVHQAASACHDYFKWGDFLTGNGNDHAECGWLDRDYVGLMLACSTGIVNEVPYSYGAHWGMPDELGKRRMALVNTFGAAGSPLWGLVQDMQHRDVDVLMLYPLDLVATDERFGSWMTQYGYANVITQGKLLEQGKLIGGALELGGRRFTTVVATFEPFPSKRLLAMLSQMAEAGGRVIWSGPPPVLTAEGESALPAWQRLFGVRYTPGLDEGLLAPGRQVGFSGVLSHLPPMTILTDLLPDRVYTVEPDKGTEVVAHARDGVVGAIRRVGETGAAVFLGFRPRDDQSASLGYETRTWFEILSTLGAYPPTGQRGKANDNTEHMSRTTAYLTCRFPNGTTAICPHFRSTVEAWSGGFARDKKADEEYLKRTPPPSETIDVADFEVNGHTVTYKGVHALAFRVDADGRLIAFAGGGANKISIDGRETIFADADIWQLAWAPVAPERRVAGGAILQAMVYGTGTVHIPAVGLPARVALYAEGPRPGSRGEQIPCAVADGKLTFTVTDKVSGRWLYATPAP